MMNLLLNILGKVLFIANSNPGALACKSYFYTVKTKILLKYGTKTGFDLQHIEGKKCFSCGGTGVYTGYHYSGRVYRDTCYRCAGGWYKRPHTNKLDKYRLGKNIFHLPVKTMYKYEIILEKGTQSDIEGYIYHYNNITHDQSKECILWLLLLFNLKQFKYFWQSAYLYFSYTNLKLKYPLTAILILKGKSKGLKYSIKNFPAWVRNTIHFKFIHNEPEFEDLDDIPPF
jgi:hypothetical protein